MAKIDESKKRAARYALQTILTTVERRLHKNEIKHLRQRDYREIDALQKNLQRSP